MKLNKEMLKAIAATTSYSLGEVSEIFGLFESYDDTILTLEICMASNKSYSWVYDRINTLDISVKDLHSLFIGD